MNLPINYIMLAGAALGGIISGSVVGIAVGGGVLFLLYFLYETVFRPFDAKVDWTSDITCCVVSLHAQLAKSDGQVTGEEIRHFREACYIEPGSERIVSAIYDMSRKSRTSPEYWARKLTELTLTRPDVRAITFDGLCYVAVKSGNREAMDQAYYPYLNIVAHSFGFGRDFVDARLAYVSSDNYNFSGQSNTYNEHASSTQDSTSQDLKNAYACLGIPTNSKLVNVKKAYKQKMKKLHPDALSALGISESDMKKAADELHKVQDAYSLLKKSL